MSWGAIKDAMLDPAGFIRWWWREHSEWPSTPCADCGIELMPNTPPDSRDWQRFMVYDEVWAAAGMAPLSGWLCIGCLEVRLGRQLVGADFEPLPINDPGVDDDAPRLDELKWAAWEYHTGSS